MNEYTKLFEKSCLLQFSVKSWQCSKVIDQNVMRSKWVMRATGFAAVNI